MSAIFSIMNDGRNKPDLRQPQGVFAKFNGYWSPISTHILCFEHSIPFQPLQPAETMTEEEKEKYHARCCPFCEGKVLHPVWKKAKRYGEKRAFKMLRTAFTKYVKSCEPPDIIKKYLTK